MLSKKRGILKDRGNTSSDRARIRTVAANGTAAAERMLGAGARHLIGCASGRQKSMVLVGHLKVLLEPGVNPEARSASVERIAAARSPGTAA
jgi:hypothetical protein